MTVVSIPRPVFLGNFRVVRPRYETSQKAGFDWLTRAHVRAQRALDPQGTVENFERKIALALRRYGCSDGQIETRGHELPDFGLENFDEMQVFRLDEGHEGRGLDRRMAFYAERCQEVLDHMYPAVAPTAALTSGASIPDLLIHVSCTGYASPNPTQRLISARQWTTSTVSTQAYHMGCYAAIPAIRQAAAQILSGFSQRADVVHNELCTLHFNPARHEPEQLVVQSLFADGHIAYELNARSGNLRLLALGEEILPGSLDEMTWTMAPHNFRMTLGREVPRLIATHVRDFVTRLYLAAGLDVARDLKSTRAALHPGGPRIIDGLREVLELQEETLTESRAVLREMGNMSSATVPHIWDRMLKSATLPAGTPILSLAFGPGLSMVGLLAVTEGPHS